MEMIQIWLEVTSKETLSSMNNLLSKLFEKSFKIDYWMQTLGVLMDVDTQRKVVHLQRSGAFKQMDLILQFMPVQPLQ